MKKNTIKSCSVFSVLLVLMSFSACKKSKVDPPVVVPEESNTKQTPTTNRLELSNDSLFLYAKEIYFWNESLPTYDAYEPRKYSTSSASGTKTATQVNLENNLFNLVKASGSADFVADGSSLRYSYISDIKNNNPTPTAAAPTELASVDLEGNGNDIGIYNIKPILNANSTTEYKLYISAVAENSPAAKNGLTRGTYITKINGLPIGTAVDRQIIDAEVNAINQAIYLNPTSVQLEGVKIDGTTFNVTLNKTSYKSSPIYKSNVLTAGSHKIGYLSYARFSNSTNSVAALTSVFSDFATKGVTDLVIDLRYNGGGYVSTAEYLINLIAPSTATGTMYIEHFNNRLKNRKQSDPSILTNQPLLDANDKLQYGTGGKIITYADIDYSVAGNTNSFSKKGTLTSVTNVVFIVSGRTASASELVINSLKPKMNVTLVGERTYGKPIGFFPIRLENRYDVYYSLFETKNANGEGGYYSGIAPQVPGGTDYSDYDWGNPAESYLQKAINVIAPGVTAVVSANRVMSATAVKGVKDQFKEIGDFDTNKEFVGMIEDRFKIKK